MSERDIVERLRLLAKTYPAWREVKTRSLAAADEIERLRAEHSVTERLVAGQLSARLAEVEAERDAERAAAERLRAEVDLKGYRVDALSDEIKRLRVAGDALADSVDLTQFAKAAEAWQEARRDR